MTTNQLRYHELEETKRSHLENESLGRDRLAFDKKTEKDRLTFDKKKTALSESRQFMLGKKGLISLI